MKIGEISKILGINTSTVRFYERHGLIDSSRINRAENGYRIYSQRDLEDLRLIIKFKEFGLELKEIQYLLSEKSRSCGDLVSSIDEQLEKCRQMESIIQARISTLNTAKKSCGTACKPSAEVRGCCASSAR